MDVRAEILRVLQVEREALDRLLAKVDDQAVKAVDLLAVCKGRAIVTGMGKAGLVGRKIAATLASTGTPALFLHPAEAFHGDLGIVTADDVVIAISNSGETDEIVRLLPHLKRFEVKIIALTGKPKSTLAKHSDVVIDVAVESEADPLGIAPTASTTVTLAMGDALAGALLKKRGFDAEKFAIFHPGGSLGKKLLLVVKDLMHTGERVPSVHEDVTLREAVYEMSSKKLGSTFVVERRSGKLLGVFTDGDLRRVLQRNSNPLELPISEIMTRDPRRTTEDALAAEALRTMEERAITVLPVVDGHLRPIGAIHLHDLVRAGLA